MKIIDIITDWIYDSALFEMAFKRKDLEAKITAESYQVLKHLIKILKWKDELNYNKHIGDINSWLFDIQTYIIKGNRKPSQQDYFQWMFLDIVNNELVVTRFIKGLHHYHNLPVVRDDFEVYNYLKMIMLQVSEQLAKNEFNGVDQLVNGLKID